MTRVILLKQSWEWRHAKSEMTHGLKLSSFLVWSLGYVTSDCHPLCYCTKIAHLFMGKIECHTNMIAKYQIICHVDWKCLGSLVLTGVILSAAKWLFIQTFNHFSTQGIQICSCWVGLRWSISEWHKRNLDNGMNCVVASDRKAQGINLLPQS